MLFFLGLKRVKKYWVNISIKRINHLFMGVKIHSTSRTILDIKETIIKRQKGAYMRFGDGDIFLMLGRNDMLQKANDKLAKEMRETMEFSTGTLHKAFPLHSKLFGFEKGMSKNMHLVSNEEAINFLTAIIRFVDIKNIYSPIALHYLATFNHELVIDFLVFLKEKRPIFVGNKNIEKQLIVKLFGEIHIKTPELNSYLAIDRVEKELEEILISKNEEFKVVVVAMGCSGRILQKRILQKGYNVYMFDFGSLLDAFNNKNTRLWIELSGGTYMFKKILENIN